MVHVSVYALSLLVVQSTARVWHQAEPTTRDLDRAGLLTGCTPKPTPGPERWLGFESKQRLFGRQVNDHTCGYTNGDPTNPLVCGRSSSCAFFGAPYHYFGCCEYSAGAPGANCYQLGACVGYSSHIYTNTAPFLYNGTGGLSVLCGFSGPDCLTTYMEDIQGVAGTYTHYDCVSGGSSTIYLQGAPTLTSASSSSASSSSSDSSLSQLITPAAAPSSVSTASSSSLAYSSASSSTSEVIDPDFTPPDSSTSSSIVVSSSVASSSTATSASVAVGSSTTSSTSAATPTSSSTGSKDVGALVHGMIPGLVGLALVMVYQ